MVSKVEKEDVGSRHEVVEFKSAFARTFSIRLFQRNSASSLLAGYPERIPLKEMLQLSTHSKDHFIVNVVMKSS